MRISSGKRSVPSQSSSGQPSPPRMRSLGEVGVRVDKAGQKNRAAPDRGQRHRETRRDGAIIAERENPAIVNQQRAIGVTSSASILCERIARRMKQWSREEVPLRNSQVDRSGGTAAGLRPWYRAFCSAKKTRSGVRGESSSTSPGRMTQWRREWLRAPKSPASAAARPRPYCRRRPRVRRRAARKTRRKSSGISDHEGSL